MMGKQHKFFHHQTWRNVWIAYFFMLVLYKSIDRYWICERFLDYKYSTNKVWSSWELEEYIGQNGGWCCGIHCTPMLPITFCGWWLICSDSSDLLSWYMVIFYRTVCMIGLSWSLLLGPSAVVDVNNLLIFPRKLSVPHLLLGLSFIILYYFIDIY